MAALTFDDGLVDNFTVLLPLLSAAEAPATAFIVSGWLGEPHPDAPWTRCMTAQELRVLSKADVEIGGHSLHHGHLPDLDQKAAESDMRTCRTDLEGVLDREVSVFAYPYGGATQEIMRACAKAGYRAACRAGGTGRWNELFNLPRQDMQNRDSSFGFWLKRHNLYEPVVATAPGLALRRTSRLLRSTFDALQY